MVFTRLYIAQKTGCMPWHSFLLPLSFEISILATNEIFSLAKRCFAILPFASCKISHHVGVVNTYFFLHWFWNLSCIISVHIIHLWFYHFFLITIVHLNTAEMATDFNSDGFRSLNYRRALPMINHWAMSYIWICTNIRRQEKIKAIFIGS